MSDGAESSADNRPVVGGFESGQQVWVAGKAATFLYREGIQAAVIRYHGEQTTRVVPVRKIAVPLPDGEGPAPG